VGVWVLELVAVVVELVLVLVAEVLPLVVVTAALLAVLLVVVLLPALLLVLYRLREVLHRALHQELGYQLQDLLVLEQGLGWLVVACGAAIAMLCLAVLLLLLVVCCVADVLLLVCEAGVGLTPASMCTLGTQRFNWQMAWKQAVMQADSCMESQASLKVLHGFLGCWYSLLAYSYYRCFRSR
jgi:hypothetical protein